MKKIFSLVISLVPVIALNLVSLGTAGAQQDSISALGHSSDKARSALDKVEDKLEHDLEAAERLDKKLDKVAEGTPEEEALDQEITALENQISQLENTLSENQ